MMKQLPVALLVLLTPTASVPQRYGRPYNLAEKPQLLLQIKVQAKSQYFRVSTLRTMQRSVVTQIDSVTNVSHVYEGVSLEKLIPILASGGQSIQIEFGSHRTVKLLLTEIDFQVEPIVVDKVDGKELSGYTPFCFVVKLRGKPVETIPDVECIAVKSSG